MFFICQDKDLKQYMDDCGNIMSMHNVKVGLIPACSTDGQHFCSFVTTAIPINTDTFVAHISFYVPVNSPLKC